MPPPVGPAIPPPAAEPVIIAGQPLAHWVAMMGSDSDLTRSEAAARLEELGDKRAAVVLPLLADPSVEVRRGAAFVLLGEYTRTNPELTAAFRQTLADSDATVRHIALQALARLEPAGIAESTEQLAKLLQTPTETEANRAAIARLLGRLEGPSPPALAALAAVAQSDPDEKVRTACLAALAKLGSPAEIVPVLAIVLRKDSSPVNRRLAAFRLGALGPAAASVSGELKAATADTDKEVAAAAQAALAKVGSQ
jgi:HEAT repeat protein